MLFSSEEVESRCRIGRTDLRRVEEEKEEQEQKRGQRGGGGTRSAVTSAATLATQKPPHRYRRAVGQAVAFTTELE